MLEKIREIEHKYEDIQAHLAAPETYADPALVARLNREEKELAPLIKTYRAWKRRRSRERRAELRRDLFLEEDQPVIYKERVTYDVSGRPVEFSENTYIGEIYKYYIHIVNVREGR